MAVRHASVLPCLGMGIQTQKNAGDKWPYPRRVNPGGTYFFFAVFFAGFFAAFFVAKTLTSLHTFKVDVTSAASYKTAVNSWVMTANVFGPTF